MTTLCYSDALTAYIQQIGRAGRSGIEAEGILYFNNSDIGNPSVKKTMKEYCRNVTECRRKVLKRYFGCDDETVLNNCQPELLVLWKFKKFKFQPERSESCYSGKISQPFIRIKLCD